MLTCGLIILSSFLAQSEDPLTADYTDKVGKLMEIVYFDGAPLPPGWPESGRRSGRLEKIAPRPRNLGEYTLTVTWDEPWAAPVTETLNDTLRNASGIHKLVVTPENELDRVKRIQDGWSARGFELIATDPLDPQGWMPSADVVAAKRAQQMARENTAATSPSEPVSALTQPPAATAEERAPAGLLTMRGPQLLIGLTALVLAGVVVKTLVL